MTKTIDEIYGSNIELFKLIAGDYVHYGCFESADDDANRAKERTIDRLMEWGSPKANSRILDLGCGLGATAHYLSHHYSCAVDGIDPAVEQIGFAEKHYSRAGRIRFQLGTAEEIPFPDACFDLILSIEVFCHVSDLQKAFRECLRVLKPGGKLVFTDFVAIRPGRSHASDFYYQYAHIHRESLTTQAEITELVRSGFKNAEFSDHREQFKRNFEYGLARLKANERKMKSGFGADKYDYMSSMYNSALTPEFLDDLSWAWFKAEN